MKNFLTSEIYYLRKEFAFRMTTIIFTLVGIALPVWIGLKTGFALSHPAEPLRISTQLSLFMYFIIPVHACYFATEGYEYGSIKNIISSGQSRQCYFIGKYVTELLAILGWVVQFFGVFYILYLALALLVGSPIGNNDSAGNLMSAMLAVVFNFLYLAAYASIVMMAGILIKRTASAIIFTFLTVFGDFLLSGYLKDSAYAWLRAVSEHTLMTQIFKFSGQYVVNSKLVVPSGPEEYLRMTLIPLIIIAVCLTLALLAFRKSDIVT